jgi:predicted small lipoprotein YifL
MRFLFVFTALIVMFSACGVKGPPLPALDAQKTVKKETVGVQTKEEKKNDKNKTKSLTDK